MKSSSCSPSAHEIMWGALWDCPRMTLVVDGDIKTTTQIIVRNEQHICHCGQLGNTLALEHRGYRFNPGTGRYIVAQMAT